MSDLYNFTLGVSEPVATSPDQSRQAATGDEYISIKEALDIFNSHGRATTERALQRYCDKHQLIAQKRITGEGEKWFVLRSSVLTRIKELEAFDALRASRQVATDADLSVPVAEVNQKDFVHDQSRQAPTEIMPSPTVAQEASHTTSPDMSRQAATGRDVSEGRETSHQQNTAGMWQAERELYERLLKHYEDREADLLRDKEMLVEQLKAKDKQIDRFFESDRDTKTLAGRFQSLMSGLWPKKAGESGERYVPIHEALESGLEGEQRKEQDR